MFKVFRVATQKWEKKLISEKYRIFSNALKFQILFSNHCSNEKVPKTKVIDLKILSKFGIQKFFIRDLEIGEKLSLQNEILNFSIITKLPSHHLVSFLSLTP